MSEEKSKNEMIDDSNFSHFLSNSVLIFDLCPDSHICP